LWFMISGMMASASAPNIQIDPYNSTIIGNQVWLTVKFGTAAQNPGVTILDASTGTTVCGRVGVTRNVAPGDSVSFRLTCTLQRGRQYLVVVDYTAGGRTYRQTLNWQP